MSVRKRRSYAAEFKKNAVLLCDEQGRTIVGVAESLGIPKDVLYRWRRELTIQKEIGSKMLKWNVMFKKKFLGIFAEHRNEIQVLEVKTLYVSDEEDVPDPTNFHERILFVV